jgi:hypothetical protein
VTEAFRRWLRQHVLTPSHRRSQLAPTDTDQFDVSKCHSWRSQNRTEVADQIGGSMAPFGDRQNGRSDLCGVPDINQRTFLV